MQPGRDNAQLTRPTGPRQARNQEGPAVCAVIQRQAETGRRPRDQVTAPQVTRILPRATLNPDS